MTRKLFPTLVAVACGTVLAVSGTWSRTATAVEPYLGQIEYFAFNFPPRNWVLCDGQILPINQNQALFSLLGTTFGGDGRTSFALPDMRGRMPVHDGGSAGTGLTRRTLGSKGGAEKVTLDVTQIPSHTHTLRGTTTPGNQVLPQGNTLADDAPDQTYRNAAPNTDMHAGSIGSSSPGDHDNMPPNLVISCNIAVVGLFPPRN